MIICNEPILKPIKGTGFYGYAQDHEIIWNDKKIIVPTYFKSNGANIPSIAQPLTYTPFHPLVIASAGAHDWVYWSHCLSRGEADEFFCAMLIYHGVSEFKAQMMRNAVRTFGGKYWENTDQDKRLMKLHWQIVKDLPNAKKYGFPEFVK